MVVRFFFMRQLGSSSFLSDVDFCGRILGIELNPSNHEANSSISE
jgi:hypothetical protein